MTVLLIQTQIRASHGWSLCDFSSVRRESLLRSCYRIRADAIVDAGNSDAGEHTDPMRMSTISQILFTDVHLLPNLSEVLNYIPSTVILV